MAVNLPHGLPTADAQAGLSQNDAGSGGDAGDAPSGAVLVANVRRVFTANLTPPGVDSDWYRHEMETAFCSVAKATTSSAGTLTLTADADGSPRVSRAVEPRRSLEIAIASPAGGTPFLGFEPGSSFAAASTDGEVAPDPGRYSFAFQSFRLSDLDPEGDGESPEAGPAPAGAAAAPSGCSAGSVSSYSDAEDWYFLDVASARELTVSFAVAGSSGGRLDLLAPSGEVRASLASGELASVWAGQGRWHLVVRAPAAQPPGALATPVAAAAQHLVAEEETTVDYLIGLTDGPGSSNACRPSCLG